MGIKQLMNLIKENAPNAIRSADLSRYTGRIIVCDASMAMYQFLIATTQTSSGSLQILTDESGMPTAHLLGIWNRTIQFLENGIKPVWVFDGKPPDLKAGTLSKRRKAKEEALQKLEQATEQGKQNQSFLIEQMLPCKSQIKNNESQMSKRSKQVKEIERLGREKIEKLIGKPIAQIASEDFEEMGESDVEEESNKLKQIKQLESLIASCNDQNCDLEEVKKQTQRSVTISQEMIEDTKLMLQLMGIAIVQAPSEAEAQCAAFVKSQKAFAVASEDMDSLTFGANILLRGFNNKKEPIIEITYKDVLEGLQLSPEEFVELCILCGCDYAQNIDGIGPVTALKLIKEHHTIESVLLALEEHNQDPSKKKKYLIPPDFAFDQARYIFHNPEVNPEIQIKFGTPNEAELTSFLVNKKGFKRERVETGIKKMKNIVGKPQQTRLENFFSITTVKRKNPEIQKSSVKSRKTGSKKK